MITLILFYFGYIGCSFSGLASLMPSHVAAVDPLTLKPCPDLDHQPCSLASISNFDEVQKTKLHQNPSSASIENGRPGRHRKFSRSFFSTQHHDSLHAIVKPPSQTSHNNGAFSYRRAHGWHARRQDVSSRKDLSRQRNAVREVHRATE